MNFEEELAKLEQMETWQLKERFTQVFGEKPHSHRRKWLVKRIIWKLQSLEEGPLSERALKRAEEIRSDHVMRVTPPKSGRRAHPSVTYTGTLKLGKKDTGFVVGTKLTRIYKGTAHQTTVIESGFLYESAVFGSLSAVAKAITGKNWSGHQFFKVGRYAEGAK